MADQFPLAVARRLADKIVGEISPFCVRAEVAGSIRREKPLVKDIEIVAIPRWDEQPDPADLFQESKLRVNLLCEDLKQREHVQWIKPGTSVIEPWPLKPEGKYWRGLLANGMKLDMFLAEPDNYGAIKLIRTGSMEFNVALFSHAGRVNVEIDGGWFWKAGERIATPEEEDVFGLLGLEYVEPRDRIDGRAVRRV
jgi:DNA polymerase/3'-5' exonuclease PolX